MLAKVRNGAATITKNGDLRNVYFLDDKFVKTADFKEVSALPIKPVYHHSKHFYKH